MRTRRASAPERRTATSRGARRAASLLTILLGCAGLGAAGAGNAPPPARKLDAVEARIQSTEAWMRDARRTESRSTRELREAEEQLAASKQQLAALQAEQRTLMARSASLGQVIASGEAEQRGLAEQAAVHLRALQRSGGGDPIRALLSAEDPAAASSLLSYYGYLSRARQQVTQRMRVTHQRLLADRARLDAKRTLIAAKQQEVLAESQRIAALQSTRQVAVTQVRQEIGNRAAELKSLQAERAALRRLIESLARRPPPPPPPIARPERAGRNTGERMQSTPPTPTGSTVPTVAASTAFARTRGQLPWPVQGTVEARYGSPKGDTSMRWEGVLIRANAGTEVRAVHAGQVAFAGWLRSLGNLLIVDHGGGYMSLYAHLDSLTRRTGDRIEPGGEVGRVGTSGGRDTPALYFEIRQGGNPVDPGGWLSRR